MTDATGMLAQPLETITRSGPQDPSALERIAQLVEQNDVGQVVVGLPLHMDGRSGPEADAARAFGAAVAERAQVSVDFLDERWTTREARRIWQQVEGRARKRKGHLDRIAAAILLETYLERTSA